TDGRKYPWGNAPVGPDFANTKIGGPGQTTPVGSYPRGASPYGVLDMSGNVEEWTADSYRQIDKFMTAYTLRGGDWFSPPFGVRASIRPSVISGSKWTAGFRCAQ